MQFLHECPLLLNLSLSPIEIWKGVMIKKACGIDYKKEPGSHTM
jgi:hypothetical protein